MAKKSAAFLANQKAFKARTELAKTIWAKELKGKKGKTFAHAISEAAKRMKKK